MRRGVTELSSYWADLGVPRWSGAVHALPGESLPESWEYFLAKDTCVLLESAKGGRYTVVVPEVKRWFYLYAGEVLCREWAEGVWRDGPRVAASPLAFFEAWQCCQKEQALPYGGGLLGALAYESVFTWERLARRQGKETGAPLGVFALAQRGYVFDGELGVLHLFDWSEQPGDGEAWWLEMQREWSAAKALVAKVLEAGEEAQLRSVSMDEEAFTEAVSRVQEYIRSGDTYQVNISMQQRLRAAYAPVHLYERLRRINPSPYMGWLPTPEGVLMSGSPELLFRRRGDVLEARPIAGTRRVGSSEVEDEALATELLTSAKERAEHLMLVDLIRNDLGRVSVGGTVAVSEFMVLESYSHVQHIVSHVQGRLREDCSLADAMQSMFPGGTITGAPKVRTMEIIEEVEPVDRGFYTGSLGWIGFNQDMQMNILIRSLWYEAESGEVCLQTGAGIVADSQAGAEYEECLHKARAAWAACGIKPE